MRKPPHADAQEGTSILTRPDRCCRPFAHEVIQTSDARAEHRSQPLRKGRSSGSQTRLESPTAKGHKSHEDTRTTRSCGLFSRLCCGLWLASSFYCSGIMDAGESRDEPSDLMRVTR